jgi:ubiquinol-cytochrome c reductase iron-sulfur subunit
VTSQQPSYAQNEYRSRKPEYLVLVGICTHLGCSPTYRPELAPADLGAEWRGGWYCPCHGSRFDLAGRVYKNVPAATNLEVPPYYFKQDQLLVVGEDGTAA